MFYLATVDLDFLKFLLFVFEIKNGRRYISYLDACQVSLNSMHLGENYVCANVCLMRADLLEFRFKEAWPRDAVSSWPGHLKIVISLCWRTMDMVSDS